MSLKADPSNGDWATTPNVPGLGSMMAPELTITQILRHALRWHGEQVIVSKRADGGLERYDYRAFGRRVAQLAHALKAGGVQPGMRVASLAWNSDRHLELYFAVSCLGAVIHTMNPRLFDDQLIYIANDAEDQWLFFEPMFAPTVVRLLPQLDTVERFVALGDASVMPAIHEAWQSATHGRRVALNDYESLLQGLPTEFGWPELNERMPSALCYTSGTTGKPKGVLYDHRSTVLHALSVSGGDAHCMRASDSVLPIVPMFHANAWGLPYVALMNGAKLVFPGHQLDGASIVQLINDESVSMIAGVPTVMLDVMKTLKGQHKRIDSVQRLLVGGSAMPLAMIESFRDDYGVEVLHGWGMTEMSPVGTLSGLKAAHHSLSPQERSRVTAMQGRPIFGVDLRIVDDEGRCLPHDGQSVGALQVRGFAVVGSYFKGASPESFTSDGWFNTGDVGSIDACGYLRLTDRTKDVIKSGGEWISSIDLENLAMSHPDVQEAACIAMSDPKWDERPLLVVVAKPERQLTREALLEHYEGKVAKWWIPDDVVFVDELPHTATGKLSKLQLRQRFKDHRPEV